jgi:hypothetical protein
VSQVRILRRGSSTESTDKTTTIEDRPLSSMRLGNGATGHSSKELVMNTVFILWHSHEVDGQPDLKRICVYKWREETERSQARLDGRPGFRDYPKGFDIH